jgi:hypothetical protein
MRRSLLVACLVIAPFMTLQAQSFQLTCKSSSSTTVRVVPDFHEVFIDFQKGSQPAGAGGANLAPGSCSWGDRAMRPEESGVLCAKAIFNYEVIFTRTGTPRYSFVQTYISRMQQDGQVLTFLVHGEFTTAHVQNCLIIDQVL